jgi:hypothetical protein
MSGLSTRQLCCPPWTKCLAKDANGTPEKQHAQTCMQPSHGWPSMRVHAQYPGWSMTAARAQRYHPEICAAAMICTSLSRPSPANASTYAMFVPRLCRIIGLSCSRWIVL